MIHAQIHENNTDISNSNAYLQCRQLNIQDEEQMIFESDEEEEIINERIAREYEMLRNQMAEEKKKEAGSVNRPDSEKDDNRDDVSSITNRVGPIKSSI